MSIAREEIDEFLLREWSNHQRNRRREDVERLLRRAVDKVFDEFSILGFAGFRVTTDANGDIQIEGITADQLAAVPAHLLKVKP